MTGNAQVGTIESRDSRRRLFLALCFCCTPAYAQTIAFDLQNYPDSPIAIVNFIPGTIRTGTDRRQFVTVKNQSDKAIGTMIFQQSISNGAKIEIVTLERVSVIISPREKKRLSVSVADLWNRIQAGETIGKPVLSVVAVEFLDGTEWNAPMGRAQD